MIHEKKQKQKISWHCPFVLCSVYDNQLKKDSWNYGILGIKVTNDAICKRNNTGTIVIISLKNFCVTSREIFQIAQ